MSGGRRQPGSRVHTTLPANTPSGHSTTGQRPAAEQGHGGATSGDTEFVSRPSGCSTLNSFIRTRRQSQVPKSSFPMCQGAPRQHDSDPTPLVPAAPWRCCYRDVSYFAIPFCEMLPFTYVTYPSEEPLLVKAVNVLAAARGCMRLLEDPHGPCSPAAPEVCTATGRLHQQPLCPPSSKFS